MYATVQRATLGNQEEWTIRRHRYIQGGLKWGSSSRHATLAAAVGALSDEVQVSEAEHDPVPRDEWPEDADEPWIIFSPPKQNARTGGRS